MRTTLIFLGLMPALVLSQVDSTYIAEVLSFQEEQNSEFADPEHSPLTEEAIGHFHTLDYYEVDRAYQVTGKFKRTKKAKEFEMPLSKERKKPAMYKEYGVVTFELNGVKYELHLYQNLKYKDHEEYGKYLFLPFKDQTNGKETYGGGRFMDVLIPTDKTVTLDFNKTYNPYCAYNHKYSCPIPPTENHLPIEITAGVKANATIADH